MCMPIAMHGGDSHLKTLQHTRSIAVCMIVSVSVYNPAFLKTDATVTKASFHYHFHAAAPDSVLPHTHHTPLE